LILRYAFRCDHLGVCAVPRHRRIVKLEKPRSFASRSLSCIGKIQRAADHPRYRAGGQGLREGQPPAGLEREGSRWPKSRTMAMLVEILDRLVATRIAAPVPPEKVPRILDPVFEDSHSKSRNPGQGSWNRRLMNRSMRRSRFLHAPLESAPGFRQRDSALLTDRRVGFVGGSNQAGGRIREASRGQALRGSRA
jgi:hypothetical protein